MIARTVREGNIMPRGYGVAWFSPVSPHAICYPVPLNVILGLLRRTYIYLREGPQTSDVELLKAATADLYKENDELRKLAIDLRDRIACPRCGWHSKAHRCGLNPPIRELTEPSIEKEN